MKNLEFLLNNFTVLSIFVNRVVQKSNRQPLLFDFWTGLNSRCLLLSLYMSEEIACLKFILT